MMSVPKLRRGDRVAVVSPSFAAPGVAPAIHDQAMMRLASMLGLVPVEYPTTRKLDASPLARATDINAAFADPSIRAVLTTIGGDDQITVIPHLEASLALADPKPFVGYSDNTNLLNWLWHNGISGYHGGATQVHLGPGPDVDEIHLASLRAALVVGGELEITDPGESEDYGVDWLDPRALVEFGDREFTDPWVWAGPEHEVSGATWGGCLEVVVWLGLAGRLPSPQQLAGAILLIETSEELPSAHLVRSWLRALGEGGILSAVEGVLVARPPASSLETPFDSDTRARLRAEQCSAVLDVVTRYNPDAVVCVGVPFGHTRPQWVLPYGGVVTLDGAGRRIIASYA